jgi:hypothetical protein
MGDTSPDSPSEHHNFDITIIFHLFEDPSYFSHGNPLFYVSNAIVQTINALIIVSTVALCMESMPEYNPDLDGNESWEDVWTAVELTCVICFSLDFVVRAGGAWYAEHLPTFCKDPMNWVDVLAIMPFYMEMMIGDMLDLRFVRVIRLARILRALRSPRFGNMGKVITDIIRNSAAALAIPIYFMMLALVLFSSLVYYAEEASDVYGCYSPAMQIADIPTTTDDAHAKAAEYAAVAHLGNAQASIDDAGATLVRSCGRCPCYKTNASLPACLQFGETGGPLCHTAHFELYDMTNETIESGPMFASIPDTFWWCIVTFTTVGYGDKAPRTAIGRWLGTFTMFMGIFFIAMPLTIVGASFSASWDKIKNDTATNDAEEEALDTSKDSQSLGFRIDVESHIARIADIIEDAKALEEDASWDDIDRGLAALKENIKQQWPGKIQ